MYFQIKEIILWSKNPDFEPRRLTFELGKVNVISGASRTGKSAIIPIIDYCLGANECKVPVNTIRDACEWFGILVQTSFGQKLFARHEPGDKKITGDMFVLEGVQIEIPKHINIKQKTNVNAVKHLLDELVGLTGLDFDSERYGSGFLGRPSFRDLGAFNFQPQNLVANQDVFFFKSDTYEHREKLRTIFPYVLNAITPQLMAKQHELEQLRKELRRKRREFATVRQISERWIAEIQAHISEAKELGLVKRSIPTYATKEELVTILRDVAKSFKDEIIVTEESVSEAVEELVKLQKEEMEISLELSGLRKRFVEMSALKESAKQYYDALQIQRDRLKISEWLSNTHDPNHDCPLCGNSLSSATEKLNSLHNSLTEIEKTAGEFKSIPAAFEREFERVRADIRTTTDKLKGIRIRKEALEKSSGEAKQRQYDSLKVSRFIGNVEQSLKIHEHVGEDSDLRNEIEELQERVKELEIDIYEGRIEDRKKRALNKVNLNAGRLLPYLDTERPNDPIFLSTQDLSIKVKGIDREDYLWEIGSGSNWLSYHVAVTLGLQQFFLDLNQSPVPSFLVYDQPSQVYFPKRLAIRKDEVDLDPKFRDEDVEAVKKVFKVFSSVVENSSAKLQIIVLDHAAENVWGNIENVHLVEEWRYGRTLVPTEWLNG